MPTSGSTGNRLGGIIGRARDLLRSYISSVRSSLQAQQPKPRRIGHQYSKPRPAKQPEEKTLEISVLDFMGHEEFMDENGSIPQVLPNYNLGKDDILFSGTVDLMTNDKENAIKATITEVLTSRIPGILPDNFSFVKINRKQVCTPACKEGQKWDFPQVKIMAGQGKLYVHLEKPRAMIGQGANNHQPSCPPAVTQWKPSLSNSSGSAPQSAAIHALYASYPQPSTSTGCVTSSSINNGPPENTDTQPGFKPAGFMTLTSQSVDDDGEEKDIIKLKMMFPNKDESYLSEIRRNNITLNDAIDDILGDEGLKAVEGWC